MFFGNKSIQAGLLVALTAIGLAFTPLKIIGALLILYLLASSLPTATLGTIPRLAVAITIAISINCLAAILFWSQSIPYDATTAILINALAGFGLLVISKEKLIVPRKITAPNTTDLLALGSSVIIAGIILLPIIFPPDQIPRSVAALRITPHGGDNVSHISMLAAINHRKGYAYGPMEEFKNELPYGSSSYPQGWHLNSILSLQLLEPIFPKIFQPTYFIVAFNVLVSLWYGLLTFLLVYATTRMMRFLKFSGRVMSFVSIGIILPVMLGPAFELISLGFATQVGSLCLIFAQSVVLMTGLQSSARRVRLFAASLLLLLSMAVSYFWFFLWPASMLISGLGTYQLLKRELSKWLLILGMTLAVIAAIQPVLLLLYGSREYSGVNEVGYIIPLPISLLSLISFSIILYFYMHKKIKELRSLLIPFFAVFSFSLITLMYQYVTVGEPRYYFHKAGYSLFIICIPLFALIAAEGVRPIIAQIRMSRSIFAFIAGGIALTSLFVLLLSPSAFKYLNRDPFGISYEQADALHKIFKQSPDSGDQIIAIGSCNREQDIKATKLAYGINGKTVIRQQVYANTLAVTDNKKDIFHQIKLYAIENPNKELYIISTDKATENELKKYLHNTPLQTKFYDIDVGRTKKDPTSCPHSLK